MATPAVFISYRRADTEQIAERLHADLVNRYGEERVFFDRQDIQRGDEWRRTLQDQLHRADLVFALIGPRWQPEWQKRRERGEDDVLHFELTEALAQGKRVIPVLVGGATLPQAQSLPPELQGLLARQAAVLDEARYASDLRQLLTHAHVPWVVGVAWAVGSLMGWLFGALAMVFVLTAAGALAGAEGAPAAAASEGLGHPAQWPGPGWMALAGALLALAVGASQWLILRSWLPLSWGMLWQYPLLGTSLMMAISAGATRTDASSTAGMGIAVLVMLLLPVAFGLLLWWSLRRHVSRAGWFTLVHHAAPILGLLVASMLATNDKNTSTDGYLAMGAVAVGSALSGAMLVWLLRRAGARRQ